MASVDWPDILNRNNIQYVERGANIGHGWIGVACPWCGSADASQHLVINLRNSGYRCWRNTQHRGRDPARLLAAILHITYTAAAHKLGKNFQPLPDDLVGEVESLFAPPVAEPIDLDMPAAFKPFTPGLPSANPFLAYLGRRGFPKEAIYFLGRRYDLRYARRDRFHNRVIFPVREEGRLVGWTGRTISIRESRRYLAEGNLRNHLLWQDELARSKASTLVVCEGPVDALKVSYLGAPDIVATCCFTSAPTEAQVAKLHGLARRFQRRLLMLDQGAVTATLQAADHLSGLLEPCWLPERLKDPGQLRNKSQLLGLVGGHGMS